MKSRQQKRDEIITDDLFEFKLRNKHDIILQIKRRRIGVREGNRVNVKGTNGLDGDPEKRNDYLSSLPLNADEGFFFILSLFSFLSYMSFPPCLFVFFLLTIFFSPFSLLFSFLFFSFLFSNYVFLPWRNQRRSFSLRRTCLLLCRLAVCGPERTV